MRKCRLRGSRHVHPFNEEACDLCLHNKPLWLHQRDSLASYTTQAIECARFEDLPTDQMKTRVHRDNLYINQEYIDAFMAAARRGWSGQC